MYGVIDIGSNTMRLSCYRVAGCEIENVFHKKNVAGLASYVDESGNLSEEGIKAAIKTLKEFKQVITNVKLNELYVIATASFRNVENTEYIVNKIKTETGIDVEVISGEEEAEYDFIGAAYKNNLNEGLLIDIGGGSTELVFFEDMEVKKAVSIPIGSLNMFNKYVTGLIPNKAEMKKIRDCVKEKLDELNYTEKSGNIILGVGGTNRAVCKLYNELYNQEKENKKMKCREVRSLSKVLMENSNAMRKVLQMVPDRVHTITPGLIILNTIAKYYSAKEMLVSECGVREGYLIYKLFRSQG